MDAPRSVSLVLIVALTAFPAFAWPSGQHSARSARHNGQAASEGSAAVATGAASVVAVPVFVLGGVVAVSGAALEEIGEGSLELRDDLFRAGTRQPIITDGVTPNGPPRLDWSIGGNRT